MEAKKAVNIAPGDVHFNVLHFLISVIFSSDRQNLQRGTPRSWVLKKCHARMYEKNINRNRSLKFM